MFVHSRRDRNRVLLRVLMSRLPTVEISGEIDLRTVARAAPLITALADIFSSATEPPFRVVASPSGRIAVLSTSPRYSGSTARVRCTDRGVEVDFVLRDLSLFPLALPYASLIIPGREYAALTFLGELESAMPRHIYERYRKYLDVVRKVVNVARSNQEGETVSLYLDTPVLKTSLPPDTEVHIVRHLVDHEGARELAEALADLGWDFIAAVGTSPRTSMYVFTCPDTETNITFLSSSGGKKGEEDVYLDMFLGRNPGVDINAAVMLGGRKMPVKIYVDTHARARLWREWERLLTYLYRQRILLDRITLE